MQELLVLHLQVRDGENDWLKYVLENYKSIFHFLTETMFQKARLQSRPELREG